MYAGRHQHKIGRSDVKLSQPNTIKSSSPVSVLLAYILDAMITQPMSILHSSTNDAASPALELLQLDDSSDAVMVPATNSAKSSLSTSQGTGPQQVADCTQPTGCAPIGRVDMWHMCLSNQSAVGRQRCQKNCIASMPFRECCLA